MQVDISNNFLEELQEGIFTCVPNPHSVDFEGFVASDIRELGSRPNGSGLSPPYHSVV
jgi:hypothetical protein